MSSKSDFSSHSCYLDNFSAQSGCSCVTRRISSSSSITDLVSSKSWLKKNGLKKQKLDFFHLLPQIGFKLSDDFDDSLKKPISSRYGHGLFTQVSRSDGHTFNIVCCQEKLKQVANKLEKTAKILKDRLNWLTSGSRRIFGVIEERRVCIVLAITTKDPRTLELMKKALEIIVEEQVSELETFNIILANTTCHSFHNECVPVSHDTIHRILDWIRNLPIPIIFSPTCVCEAVLKALKDKHVESVYLFCEGSSVASCKELLRRKLLEFKHQVRIHVNTFNCHDKELLKFLKRLSKEIGGRFHAFETYKCHPKDPPVWGASQTEMVLFPSEALFSNREGGNETSIASREDVVRLFTELENARNTLSQVNQLVKLTAKREIRLEARSTKTVEDENSGDEKENDVKEESMSSREWLGRYGIKAHGLEVHHVLEDSVFKHKHGHLDLLIPPRHPDIRTSASCKEVFVNAKYCHNFPLVKWRTGEAVHLNMTPQLQRNYEEKMMIVLNAVQQRLNWLKKGSRAVFGTVLEEYIYFVIDISSSMEPNSKTLLESIECLIKEQLQCNKKVNFVTFNRRAWVWREKMTELSPKNIKNALAWLAQQPCEGSTNTYEALKIALADFNTQGIYLLTDGRPDQPPRQILDQVDVRPNVPIHTIAFNCYDEEANHFLHQLASSTGGRYHYYSDHEFNIQPPESWRCEDVQLLEEELERGYKSLAAVSHLRQLCIVSIWKGAIKRLKNNKHKPSICAGSCLPYQENKGSCLSLSPSSHSTYSREIQNPNFHQWPFVPLCCKRKQQIMKRPNQYLFADLDQSKSRLPRKYKLKKRRRIESPPSVKEWLKKNRLSARNLTLMTVLEPTFIPHKSEILPVEDRTVFSKQFSNTSPIAHLTGETNLQVALVNPKGVNLVKYEKKLRKATMAITSFLDKIIWDALPNFTKKRLGSEEPIAFLNNKARLLAALRENNWPVSVEDVASLEREIELGFKYLKILNKLKEIDGEHDGKD